MKIPPHKQQKPKQRANIKSKLSEQSTQKPIHKKPLNIIDGIFKSKKQQKAQYRVQETLLKSSSDILKEKKEKKIAKQLKRQWRMEQKMRKANDGQIPSTKKVQSGFKVYTEEELNIGKGGNTNLCPIDCKCCF